MPLIATPKKLWWEDLMDTPEAVLNYFSAGQIKLMDLIKEELDVHNADT